VKKVVYISAAWILLLIATGTVRAIFAQNEKDRFRLFFASIFPHVFIPMCGLAGAKEKSREKLHCYWTWSACCLATQGMCVIYALMALAGTIALIGECNEESENPCDARHAEVLLFICYMFGLLIMAASTSWGSRLYHDEYFVDPNVALGRAALYGHSEALRRAQRRAMVRAVAQIAARQAAARRSHEESGGGSSTAAGSLQHDLVAVYALGSEFRPQPTSLYGCQRSAGYMDLAELGRPTLCAQPVDVQAISNATTTTMTREAGSRGEAGTPGCGNGREAAPTIVSVFADPSEGTGSREASDAANVVIVEGVGDEAPGGRSSP
jgi:hypothetical protein